MTMLLMTSTLEHSFVDYKLCFGFKYILDDFRNGIEYCIGFLVKRSHIFEFTPTFAILCVQMLMSSKNLVRNFFSGEIFRQILL